MATARPTATAPHIPPGWARLISLVIAGALALQVAALLLRTGPWAFPFINYPMYAHPHYEGERILADYTINAVYADGTEEVVTRQTLPGLFQFHRVWAQFMVAVPGDTYTLGSGQRIEVKQATGIRKWLKQYFSRSQSASAYIDAFTRKLEEKSGKAVARYRIEDFPAILTREGYKEADGVEVLKVLNIARAG